MTVGPPDRPTGRATLNPFLSRVCLELRRPRPVNASVGATISRETVDGRPFVRIWFPTRGCSKDAQGSCTMCDYGVAGHPDGDEMVAAVRSLLERHPIPSASTVLISPSGSMFDEREVPGPARESIFALIGATPATSIGCETRAETIEPVSLDGFLKAVGRERAFVEVGLESANPWVLRNCVNKMLDLRDYIRGIRTLTDHGIKSTTNVSLGSAFLTEPEAMSDAVETVRFARAAGSDLAVLFPLHVRRFTLLHWLWTHGLYSPVSLWSLVEVLARLGPKSPAAAPTTISWYRDRAGTDDNPASGIVASPGACDRCLPEVLAILDEYRDSGDFGLVERLSAFRCGCRDEWKGQLATRKLSLEERMRHAYRSAGIDILGLEWWALHGESVLESLDLRDCHLPTVTPRA